METSEADLQEMASARLDADREWYEAYRAERSRDEEEARALWLAFDILAARE